MKVPNSIPSFTLHQTAESHRATYVWFVATDSNRVGKLLDSFTISPKSPVGMSQVRAELNVCLWITSDLIGELDPVQEHLDSFV